MIPLPTIDLSAAVAGTTGTIDFSRAQPSASPHLQGDMTRWATLQVFNESGCGLLISFPGTPQGARVPAGRWGNLPIPPGVSTATYTVLYVLTGAQVSLLLADYYAPGEPVPAVGSLGNSPLGGGTVGTSTSTQQTQQIVYDPTAINGEAPNSVTSSAAAGSSLGQVDVTDANPTGGKRVFAMASASPYIDAAGVWQGPGVNHSGADLTLSSSGNIDFSVAGAISCFVGSDGIGFQKHGGLIQGCKAFSGNGSGTYSHGLSSTPNAVLVNTNNGSNSTTYGSGSYTASSVFIYQNNAQPFVAFAVLS